LKRGELHLWKIPCGRDGGSPEDLWSLLSARERAKAERLHLSSHRERYVRAHAGLRRILAHYLNLSPQHIVFSYGSVGKPTLAKDPTGIQFNLTTSADLALMAVCRDLPVGIDCEQLRPRSELESIARRMFSPEEIERIAAAPEGERARLFTLAWTGLEARVKADGRGLFRRRDLPPMPRLEVAHCLPQQGFIAAVARAELPGVPEWRTLLLQ